MAKIMAPSKVTSKESHLPIVLSTPVHIVANMLKKVMGILINDDLESDVEVLESDVEIGDENDDLFLDGMQQLPI